MTLSAARVAASEEAPSSTDKAVARSPRKRSAKQRVKYALTIALFLLPSLIPLLAFIIGPMIAAAWTSLHSWNLIGPMKWVGLDNYTTLLTDPGTQQAFLHTVYYIVGYLPLVYIGGLGMASFFVFLATSSFVYLRKLR